MGSLGFKELMIILMVVLLLFGTKRVASMGADLGRAFRGFRQAMSEGEQESPPPPKQLGGKNTSVPEAGKTDDLTQTADIGTRA